MEPNNVYKKSRKFAFTLRSRDPHIPIIKNIGIKILSKNTKKTIKSIAEKDKIKNISNNKKYKQYSFIKKNLSLYEDNKHKGTINVLNKTKNKEIPSIPNEKINLFK